LFAKPTGTGKNLAVTGEPLPPKAEARPPPDVAETVRKLNELVAARQRDLTFHVDEVSGRTVITVLDATTSKVVRQIPAEEVLALARALEDARGVLDVRA
jgi:flagellar protein FlaG